MNILITICARGGSKGIKDKNIRPVAGKPLIAYSIDVAKRWGKAKRIVCSTDSEKIAEVAKEHGAEVPFMRPESLAQDKSGKVGVIRHAYEECMRLFGEQYDFVIDLDVTSPLRSTHDLDSCLSVQEEKGAEMVFTVTKARRNPYFNMVELREDGFVELSKKLPGKVMCRQDAPRVFDMNASIYVYSKPFLENKEYNSVLSSDKTAISEMNEMKSHDIDTEHDLKFIEYLIEKEVVKLD